MASIVGELFRSDCFDPLATWWHIFHPTKVGYPTFVGYPTIEVGLPPDYNVHSRYILWPLMYCCCHLYNNIGMMASRIRLILTKLMIIIIIISIPYLHENQQSTHYNIISPPLNCGEEPNNPHMILLSQL